MTRHTIKSIALVSAFVLLFAALVLSTAYFIVEVNTVTITNMSGHDLADVDVEASKAVLWRGVIKSGETKWIYGTQGDGVISDADRNFTVSFDLNGEDPS